MTAAPANTSILKHGLYRGEIRAVNDPQKLGRCRVYVHGVHMPNSKADDLPWAEMMNYGGRGFGDIPPYDVGDLVGIMFEFGDRSFPIVIGGWTSKRGGMNDRVPENQGDFKKNRMRWTRVDKAGNLFEMSALPAERHIRLRSGRADLCLSQNDDSLIADVPGYVQIKTPEYGHVGTKSIHIVEEFSVSASSKSLLVPGRIVFSTDGVFEVCATKENLIGHDPIRPRVSLNTTLLGATVNIGLPSMAAPLRFPTMNVRIGAMNTISMTASVVSVIAPVVSIRGVASLDMECAGPITLKSAVSINLKAPIVDVGGVL